MTQKGGAMSAAGCSLPVRRASPPGFSAWRTEQGGDCVTGPRYLRGFLGLRYPPPPSPKAPPASPQWGVTQSGYEASAGNYWIKMSQMATGLSLSSLIKERGVPVGDKGCVRLKKWILHPPGGALWCQAIAPERAWPRVWFFHNGVGLSLLNVH